MEGEGCSNPRGHKKTMLLDLSRLMGPSSLPRPGQVLTPLFNGIVSGAQSPASRGAFRYGLLTAPSAGWAETASETGFVSGAPDFCGFGTELDFPTMRVVSSRHFGPRDQSKSVSGLICAGEYHRTLCSSRRIRDCLSLIAWHRPSPWYNSFGRGLIEATAATGSPNEPGSPP